VSARDQACRAAVLARRHQLQSERVDLKVATIGLAARCGSHHTTGQLCPSCQAVKDQLDQRAMAIAGTIYLN
jgi:hypothetical protein